MNITLSKGTGVLLLVILVFTVFAAYGFGQQQTLQPKLPCYVFPDTLRQICETGLSTTGQQVTTIQQAAATQTVQAAQQPTACTSHLDCGTNGGCHGDKCVFGKSVCGPFQTDCEGGFCYGTSGGAQLSITYPEYHTASKTICLPGNLRDYVRDGGFCSPQGTQVGGTGYNLLTLERNGCRLGHFCLPLSQQMAVDAGAVWLAKTFYNVYSTQTWNPVGVCMPLGTPPASEQAQETQEPTLPAAP